MKLLTMNPLYQALICCLVKLVFSIRKSMSSFGSFLLPLEPMAGCGHLAGHVTPAAVDQM